MALEEGGMRADALLFGESQSRMLLSVRRRYLGHLRDLARREDVPLAVLGEVRGQSLVIGDVLEFSVETARERWRTTELWQNRRSTMPRRNMTAHWQR